MEVVVLGVVEQHKSTNHVHERCGLPLAFRVWSPTTFLDVHTHDRRVLATHVPQLIPLQKTACLGLRGWAARELLIEADDSLHAGCVCGAADGLCTTVLDVCVSPTHIRI